MDAVDTAAQLAPGLDWREALTDDFNPVPYALAALPLDRSANPRAAALSLVVDRGMWQASLTVCRDHAPGSPAQMAHVSIVGGTDPAQVWQDLLELCNGVGCAPDLVHLVKDHVTRRGGDAGAISGGSGVSPTPRPVEDEDPSD